MAVYRLPGYSLNGTGQRVGRLPGIVFADNTSSGSTHTLTGADSTQSSSSSSGTIAQEHSLIGAGSSCTQSNGCATGGIDLTQTTVLTGGNATQAAQSASGAIGQTHVLDGAQSTQNNGSSYGSIVLPGAVADYRLVSGPVIALTSLRSSAVAIGFRMESTATPLHS